MNKSESKPSKSLYYSLFYEFFRAFTIPTVALSGALIEFWGKYPFIPYQVVQKTAEEKFKESVFADPASTKKTMDANPDKAEEIAQFAHFNCSDLFGKKSVQKTFNPFLLFF